jgi:hypothetical protein
MNGPGGQTLSKSRPWYFIDTEFKARTYCKSGTIYDVALINGFDPYASTCSYIKCDPGWFEPFNPIELTYNDLLTAPTAEEFFNFFCSVLGERKPVIWFYSTRHDVSIFYEFHERYDEARRLKSTEKSDWEFVVGFDYGFEFRNARNTSGKGKLSEVYERTTLSSVAPYRHIILHTAASDTLLLMEYVMTRELCGLHEETGGVEVTEDE